jgi:hypothetical protein
MSYEASEHFLASALSGGRARPARHLDRGLDPAAERMRGKLATGRFSVERMLPETAMHIARIRLGAANLMELPAAAFRRTIRAGHGGKGQPVPVRWIIETGRRNP